MLQLEDDPHNTVAFHVIGEFLYGNTAEDVSSLVSYSHVYIVQCPEKVTMCVSYITTNENASS